MESTPWIQKADNRIDIRTKPIDKSKRQVAHVFLFSKSSAVLFGTIEMRYAVLMVLRFDGKFGFPGGQIESEETVLDGLNRELHEEILLDEKYYLDESDYFYSNDQQNMINHFYVKEYKESELHDIETNALKSRDWGGETLGIVRVPVQDPLKTIQKKTPLAQFLRNNFVSNSREQLIEAMIKTKIMSMADMMQIWAQVD